MDFCYIQSILKCNVDSQSHQKFGCRYPSNQVGACLPYKKSVNPISPFTYIPFCQSKFDNVTRLYPELK